MPSSPRSACVPLCSGTAGVASFVLFFCTLHNQSVSELRHTTTWRLCERVVKKKTKANRLDVQNTCKTPIIHHPHPIGCFAASHVFSFYVFSFCPLTVCVDAVPVHAACFPSFFSGRLAVTQQPFNSADSPPHPPASATHPAPPRLQSSDR